MNNIPVSIIIPVYNVENYLRQCLDSIVNQTLHEIEIICVNDGSTDSSPQILEEYTVKDERIKIINKENSGSGAARNTGIKAANGEYIAFVDSDDWVQLDTYEKLYKNAISNNSDLVIFDTTRYDENENSYFYYDGFDIAKYFNDTNIDFNNFSFNYKDIKPFLLNKSFSPWAKLYKTEFLNSYDDFYFPKHTSFEDVPFHVQVLLRATRISFDKEKLYIYRISNNNSETNNSQKSRKVFDIFTIVNKVKQILIENNKMSEFKSEFIIFKINQLNNWFEKCNHTYKPEFFKRIKHDFADIGLKNYEMNQLNSKSQTNFENIINSDTYREFELLEKINLLELNYDNELKYLKQTNEVRLENQKIIFEEKLEDQKQFYEGKLEDQKQIVKKMKSSNSWKLTKPIRKLGKKIRS